MAMFESTQQAKSTDFKRRLRGYDPTEVDAAMGIMQSRIAQLENDLENKPEIIITETRRARRTESEEIAPPTWFEKQWGGVNDNDADHAFNEFFIGADVVRSPWKNSRRRS